MDAINNLRQVKNEWHNCSEWELEQQKSDARFEYLKKNINPNDKDISIFANRGKTLINAINTMDQISINKSENAMISIRTVSSIAAMLLGGIGGVLGAVLSKVTKGAKATPKTSAFIGYTIFALIGTAMSSFINSHFTKTATRVARFQTRNNEMKDVRNFVTYTDEQIEQAKKKLSEIGDVKDKTEDMSWKDSTNPIKSFKKSFEDIKILNKDYSAYKNWHSKYLKQEKENAAKLETLNLTEKEKADAEKDKNFILKTTKKLELAASNYEINTSFAVRTAATALSLLTVGGGFFASWGLGKVSKSLNKGLLSNILNYASKLSIPAGILSMILLVGPLTKLTKDAAQLGRFKGQKELLSDDKNFYLYTEEELKKVDLSPDKKFENLTNLEKFKNNFKFLSEIKQEYKEYLNYKNTKHKEELKLAEILKTMPISKQQLLEAKKIQKQTFMAFEKIDDKSEALVDDTDAAVSTTSTIINATACCIANIFTLKCFGKVISKFTQNKSMPGFFEGLKLAKNLSLKNVAMIFILPYTITRGIILLTSLFGTEIKKKACTIGIMSATNDLNNYKKFAIPKEELLFNEFKTN